MADIAEIRAAPVSRSTAGALASLSLAMLVSSLATSIANVALPTLSVVFAASFPAVQWVVLAYLLAITALIVSVGRLGDLVGRRLLLIAGLALFSAASFAAALAPSLVCFVTFCWGVDFKLPAASARARRRWTEAATSFCWPIIASPTFWVQSSWLLIICRVCGKAVSDFTLTSQS